MAGLVVPINRSATRPTDRAEAAPPAEPWALMAAAQMHSEGRLVMPSGDKLEGHNLYQARPQASLGGRSMIEDNNPELGPTPAELNEREKDMEAARRRNAK